MYPTLKPGEYIVTTDLLPASPGDIVTVHFISMDRREFFVKRLIATGGHKILIRNGIIYIDGVPKQFGPNVQWSQHRSFDLGGEPLLIPKGFDFVLGDNRNDSTDSREIGLARLAGRVIAVFPNKWW